MAEPRRALEGPPEPDIAHLITEDDEAVDNVFSEKQQRLLTETLYTSWRLPDGSRPVFAAFANVGLYASLHESAIVPDAMVSMEIEIPEEVWKKKHRCYLVWEYGKVPEIAVEVVSNREGKEDSQKLERYARIGIPYYVIYDPQKFLSPRVLRAYELHAGRYVERLESSPFPQLEGLSLGIWRGSYEDLSGDWLRWRDPQGAWLATGAESARQRDLERERADQERTRADQEHERAERERERAERLAARLRELGLDE